jgi:thioester reductase-like protein
MRLQSLLGITGGWNGLQVIESDLTQPAGGLRSSEITRLRANVQTVIPCAGDTSFFPQTPAASPAIFIDAPLALLQALFPGRLERWCQISTAFVCGRRGGTVFESEGAVGQKFHNPYEEIKLQSEIVLTQSCRRLGIDLRILRRAPASMDIAAGEYGYDLFYFRRMLMRSGWRARAFY